LNKLENGLLRDYETVFCSPVALTVLEKILACFCGFSLFVRKIFRISEPCEQILKRPNKGKFLQKISFLGIIVSEKILKELLKHTLNVYELP
jgi:hypothetical protein